MPIIARRPDHAADQTYDLIVVGGGIYGVALVLEAAGRGLRPLLLERDDFGAATSAASLRVVHGGLRYLQTLDLPRFYESVGERRWFLTHFPDQVAPLPCLMPLYGRGLKRPSTFGVALALNDLMSWRRNAGVGPDRRLPAGRLVGRKEVARLFPGVDGRGLKGGGLWHDAVMLSSERLLIEMLRWAAAAGAAALNYVEAVELSTAGSAVDGVIARDRLSGETLGFRAPRAVNAAGPWCRALAGRLDRALSSSSGPQLFRPALAFNLLFDRPPPAEVAVAVEPDRPGAATYFLLPWKGRLLAGTYHAARPDGATEARPAEAEIAAMIDDLNAAVPGLGLGRDQVARVLAGLQPAMAPGRAEPSNRPVILDHGDGGGPKGLYSVSGVKYTTARLVAETTLRRMFGGRLPPAAPPARPAPAFEPDADLFAQPDEALGARLKTIVREEAVMHLDDLLERRIDAAEWLGGGDAAVRRVRRLLDWDRRQPSHDVTMGERP